MRAIIVVAFCFATIGIAGAQQSDALKKAQASFDQAQLDYLQGKYDEAAKGFQEAYAARPFPQFLYNVGASFHMKGKKASDADAYGKAVEFYKKYLSEEPQAGDKAKVEKAIGVLEAEIKRIKDAAGATAGSAAPPPTTPSQEVQNLGEVKVRGLVVIESEPQNATIYLDDKKKGPFATTPWSGSLDGDHKVIIEKRGHKASESTISADPTKLFVLRVVMSQDQYLGFVEVTSNVPGSDVYMDDKSVGAVGKTPYSGDVKPGKHTFWVTAEGFNEHTETLDIASGETASVRANLTGSFPGKLNVIGIGIEDASIRLDGKLLCERGPCLKSVSQGDHVIEVSRPGYKPYTRRISIQAKTETNVKVALAPEPSRSDAVVAYVLAALFAGGGVYLGNESNKLRESLRKEIDTGMPPPDSEDPRFLKGKVYAISADAAYTLAGITALTALYYTFRDKGSPTTAIVDVRALAITPQVSPTYAGVGMEVHW